MILIIAGMEDSRCPLISTSPVASTVDGGVAAEAGVVEETAEANGISRIVEDGVEPDSDR